MAREAARGIIPIPAELATKIVRRRMGSGFVAQRIRRPWGDPHGAISLLGRNGARGSTANGELARARTHWTDHHRLRHGRTKKAIHSENFERGRNLVPGILRAERRV